MVSSEHTNDYTIACDATAAAVFYGFEGKARVTAR